MFSKKTYRNTRWMEQLIKLCEGPTYDVACDDVDDVDVDWSGGYEGRWQNIKPRVRIEVRETEQHTPERGRFAEDPGMHVWYCWNDASHLRYIPAEFTVHDYSGLLQCLVNGRAICLNLEQRCRIRVSYIGDNFCTNTSDSL